MIDLTEITIKELKNILTNVEATDKDRNCAREKAMKELQNLVEQTPSMYDYNCVRFYFDLGKIKIIVKTRTKKIKDGYIATLNLEKVASTVPGLFFDHNPKDIFSPIIAGTTGGIRDLNFNKRKYYNVSISEIKSKEIFLEELYSNIAKEEVIDGILTSAIQPIYKRVLVSMMGPIELPSHLSKSDPDLFLKLKEEMQKNLDINNCLHIMWEQAKMSGV